jgi:hypothetical protein
VTTRDMDLGRIEALAIRNYIENDCIEVVVQAMRGNGCIGVVEVELERTS